MFNLISLDYDNKNKIKANQCKKPTKNKSKKSKIKAIKTKQ